jgi:threonyl-tRNA synthetase
MDASSANVRPVMVHRSLIGSTERLFAHVVEVHEGAFPVSYSPVQIVAVPLGAVQRPPRTRLANAPQTPRQLRLPVPKRSPQRRFSPVSGMFSTVVTIFRSQPEE